MQPSRRPGLALTWLGHSTTLVELDQARVLTDPLLRRRAAHLVRSGRPPGASTTSAVDAVLISHVHRDHLDVPSLRLLPREALLVIPSGGGRMATRLGFRNVVEVVEGAEVGIGGVRVRVTHADHAAGRGARQRGPIPVGYLIQGSLSVYFAGDTDLFAGMSSLHRNLDLALLPIGGWGPRIPAGHLDAARAAEALALLAPRVAVPIHWRTFRPFYRVRPYADDTSAGARFKAFAHERAPEVDVRILAPGERCTIEAR